MSDKDKGKESHIASTTMMKKAGIKARQIQLETIVLETDK
jgi:dCMP deaminase